MSEEQSRPDVDLLLIGEAACALERPLKSLGYPSHSVLEGDAALVQLREVPVLAVLVDIDVEHIELRDLVKEARALQPHAATLVLAAPTRSHEVVAAMVAGFDSYLPLPPDPDLLVDRLERFLAGAFVRWQQVEEPDDGDLFVDEAPTFEWDEGTAAEPHIGADPMFGTQEVESKFATVSRVPVAPTPSELPVRAGGVKEGTVREAAPGDPVSYDPANFPPRVHDAPTGPSGPAPGGADDFRSDTVTVHATNPAAARSLDGGLIAALDSEIEASEIEDEALAFEEGEETMALEEEQDGALSSEMPTTAGLLRPKKP